MTSRLKPRRSAAKHLLDLGRLHFLLERLERLRKLVVDRFAGLRPLDQHREIVGALLQRHREIAILFETAAAQHDFLRLVLIFPEVGRGDASFEACQFFAGAGGFKDSYADPQHVG
jgi:hypothetical protein